MDDSDLWDDVPADDGEYPDSFEFDVEGKAIVGTFVDGPRKANTPYGDAFFITVVDAAGKEWSVALFHANLRAQVKEARPRKGDAIAIRYDGRGQAKPGKSAPYLYHVEVKRNDAAPATVDPQPAAATPTASLL